MKKVWDPGDCTAKPHSWKGPWPRS